MHKSGASQRLAGNLDDFVHHLRRKGVTLWKEEAGLRYRAAKGVLTSEERQVLIQENEAICSLLEGYTGVPHYDAPLNHEVRRAPLSFTQLEYWHSRLRYGGRPI